MFFSSRQSIISGTISLSLASEMSHILDFTMIAQSVRCPLLSWNRFQTLQITGHTVCEINNTLIFISVCAWMHWNICHLYICVNTTLLYCQCDQLVIWRHFHLALFHELVHLQMLTGIVKCRWMLWLDAPTLRTILFCLHSLSNRNVKSPFCLSII